MLRAGGALDLQPGGSSPRGAARIALRSLVLNALNPKLSLFFLAFLPQFLTPEAAHPLDDLAALAGVFMALTFVVYLGYGALASLARRFVLERPRVLRAIRQAFARTFAYLGARLALAD